MAGDTEIEQKVQEYERFVEEQLKSDLSKALSGRAQVVEEIGEYEALKGTIAKLKVTPQSKNLKTQVDLGCSFYAQAVIPDASRIFVKVGYGFFVELEYNEADVFCDRKIELLQTKSDQWTDSANRIKAHIRLVLEGLKELQQLNF